MCVFPSGGGAKVVNWPQQQLENGRTKNTATGGRYKCYVRALKNAENAPAADGTIKDLPSYFMERLGYNVPHDVLQKGELDDGFRATLVNLWERLEDGSAEGEMLERAEIAVQGCEEMEYRGRQSARARYLEVPQIRRLTDAPADGRSATPSSASVSSTPSCCTCPVHTWTPGTSTWWRRCRPWAASPSPYGTHGPGDSQGWHTSRTRIDGLWRVELVPTDESHIPAGGNRGPIPGFLVISQSYWSVYVRQFTVESASRSRAFFWEHPDGAEAETLTFVYENVPQQQYQHRSQRHLGT